MFSRSPSDLIFFLRGRFLWLRPTSLYYFFCQLSSLWQLRRRSSKLSHLRSESLSSVFFRVLPQSTPRFAVSSGLACSPPCLFLPSPSRLLLPCTNFKGSAKGSLFFCAPLLLAVFSGLFRECKKTLTLSPPPGVLPLFFFSIRISNE